VDHVAPEPVEPPEGEVVQDRSMVELGRLIHRLRLESDVSIGALAISAGLSAGLVSQIERGLGNPSYTTLIKLAHALKVPVGKFFSGEEPDDRVALVRLEERRRLLLSEQDLVYQLLTPSLSGKLGMLQAQIAPGWTNESVPYVHEGEECVTITQGQLFVVVGRASYTLETGDSLTYDSSVPHWYRNDTDAPAVLIGAMTPPSF
jgi:transcriptional regulator with XRE-family HTH domain